MDNFSQVLTAFLLATIAGLATGIGSCIAFFFRKISGKFLSFILGFSGGVMVYVSFVELLAESRSHLVDTFGKTTGAFYSILAFFGGIALAAIIDRLVPEDGNPHEVKKVEAMAEKEDASVTKKRLKRSGLLFALAVGIHNFPEGMAVFSAGLSEPAIGISIALAVAIHNIPEGITVSVPIYHATNSRKKAFMWSFLSGLAEPAGALVAYLILLPFISATLISFLFAAVAGIMVFITFDELLPLAEEYGEHHLVIHGLIGGMLVMAASLAF